MGLVGGVLLFSGNASGQSAQSSGPGLTGLTACIASYHRLDVVVMMDESGSLGFASDGMPATDPTNQRVPALQDLLGTLESLTTGATPVNVSVGLSGFSTNASVVQPFASLNRQTLTTMDAAASTFAAKNNGPDTDFYYALSAAEQQLAQQAASANGRTCQTLVLFTDGIYSFSVRQGLTRSYAPGLSANTQADANALAAAGENAVCRSGGLADQIRSDGTYLITVGLGPGAGPGATFLSGVAGAGGCGSIPGPGGLFLPAADVGALREVFDLAGGVIAGGTSAGKGVGVPRAFYLSADLSKVLLLVRTVAGTSNVDATLTSPSGAVISLPQSGSVSGNGLTFSELDIGNNYLELQGVVNSDESPWVGPWTVSVTSAPTGAVTTDILEFPDLAPSLDSSHTLFRGKTAAISVDLRRLNGRPPDVAQQSVLHTLSAFIVDPTGVVSPAQVTMVPGSRPDTFAGSYKVPVSDAVSSDDLVLTLTSEEPDGTVLTKVQRSVTLAVELPPSFPRIVPTRLNFGSVSGTSSSKTAVRIYGGMTKGCVSFGRQTIAGAPAGVTLSHIQAPSGCLTIGVGARRTVDLSLVHQGSGFGLLKGSVLVTSKSGTGHSLQIRLPIQASFDVPINQARRAGLLLALILGGLLLPLLLMYGLAVLGARFRPLGSLRYVSLGVGVTEVGLDSTSDRELDAAKLMVGVRPILEKSPRRIVVPEGPILRSFISINPFSAPRATAEHPDRDVVASQGTHRIGNGGWIGDLSSQLGASWVYQVERKELNAAGEPRLVGTLTLLCAETSALPNPWPEAVAHAKARLPELCTPLLAAPDGDGPSDRTTQTVSGESEQELDPRLSLNIFPTTDL
jgi:hypothetical protein